jgi:hypothetical protein
MIGIYTGGGGKEIAELVLELATDPRPETISKTQRFLMSLFIGTVTSLACLYAAKISACLLYRRIFSIPKYKMLSLVAIGMATAWFIAGSVANVCICIPVDRFWHRTKPGRCLNFNLFFLVNGIFEVVIDSAILAIPIFATHSVQMARRTKLAVSCIFLVGGFAVITGIVRLTNVYQPGQQFVSFANSEIWTRIHIAATLLCLSLPVYKPIRNSIEKLGWRLRNTYASILRSGSRTRTERTDNQSSQNSRYYSKQRDRQYSQDSDMELHPRTNEAVTVVSRYEVSHNPADAAPPLSQGVFGESRSFVKTLKPV